MIKNLADINTKLKKQLYKKKIPFFTLPSAAKLEGKCLDVKKTKKFIAETLHFENDETEVQIYRVISPSIHS